MYDAVRSAPILIRLVLAFEILLVQPSVALGLETKLEIPKAQALLIFR